MEHFLPTGSCPPGAQEERDLSLGYPCDIETFWVSLCDPGHSLHGTARVCTLSTRNLRLELKQNLEPGTVLEVELDASGRVFAPIQFARVEHIRPQPNGLYLADCALFPCLPEEVVKVLLAPDLDSYPLQTPRS
ncbi:MAG: hypothetical protein JO112_03710 [Planctomycetes bacterium]|nr:hypothetical protein [Planctomycetota bacterium]